MGYVNILVLHDNLNHAAKNTNPLVNSTLDKCRNYYINIQFTRIHASHMTDIFACYIKILRYQHKCRLQYVIDSQNKTLNQ